MFARTSAANRGLIRRGVRGAHVPSGRYNTGGLCTKRGARSKNTILARKKTIPPTPTMSSPYPSTGNSNPLMPNAISTAKQLSVNPSKRTTYGSWRPSTFQCYQHPIKPHKQTEPAIVPRAIALRTRCVESARFCVPAFAGTTVMGPCRANLAPSGPWHAPNAIALQLCLNLCTASHSFRPCKWPGIDGTLIAG